MPRSNQVIMQEFFDNLVKIVSEGSSDKYVLMVLHKFVESHTKVCPFLKYVYIDFKKIKFNKKINSVNPKFIGEFLKFLINSLFSRLFVLLVKKKIPPELAEDLKSLGIEM